MSFRFLHFPEDVPASPGLADPSPVLRRLQRCVVGAGRRTNTPLPGKWPVIFVGSPTGNRAGAPRPANAGGKAGISCERQREGYY